jgi:hypothetical protein
MLPLGLFDAFIDLQAKMTSGSPDFSSRFQSAAGGYGCHHMQVIYIRESSPPPYNPWCFYIA